MACATASEDAMNDPICRAPLVDDVIAPADDRAGLVGDNDQPATVPSWRPLFDLFPVAAPCPIRARIAQRSISRRRAAPRARPAAYCQSTGVNRDGALVHHCSIRCLNRSTSPSICADAACGRRVRRPNGVVDLLAMDRHMRRRGDAEPDAVASVAKHTTSMPSPMTMASFNFRVTTSTTLSQIETKWTGYSIVLANELAADHRRGLMTTGARRLAVASLVGNRDDGEPQQRFVGAGADPSALEIAAASGRSPDRAASGRS